MTEDQLPTADRHPGPDPGPTAPNQRTFSLNSSEAYEALCPRSDRPWIPNGALPRPPRWPRGDSNVSVAAADEDEAEGAFRAWLAHVEAGRIGERD